MKTGQIIIENQTERHVTYRIDHKAVCVKIGKCFCRQGRRSLVAYSFHVPGGKGKRTLPLHPGVTMIPELKRDLGGRKPAMKIVGAKPSEEAAEKLANKAASGDKPSSKSGKGKGGKTGQK